MKISSLKVFTTLLLVAALLTIWSEYSYAQIGIGGGVDIRSEDPTNGYGLRLEYRIIELPPFVDFRVRAHGSYFFEEKLIQSEVNGLRSKLRESNSAFDVGAAVLAGVNLGMIRPYAGLGLGVDSSEIGPRQSTTQYSGIKEENMFWNVLFGTELEIIPYVKPFFEYRFAQLLNSRNVDFNEFERLSLGVIFRF